MDSEKARITSSLQAVRVQRDVSGARCGSVELLSVTPSPPSALLRRVAEDRQYCSRHPFLACLVRKSGNERDAWWSELGAAVASRRSRAPLLLCADANARLGSVVTSAVGASRADEESNNGRAFHELLLQWRLSAVNSFWPCEDTWFSATARAIEEISSVCLLSWLAMVTDCSIEHQMPLALESKVDNSAVQVTLAQWPSLGHDRTWRRRPPFYDRSQLADSEVKQTRVNRVNATDSRQHLSYRAC